MDKYDGLKLKYNVFKVSDGSIVDNCFVLRPDKDSAAVAALRAYAEATVNKVLAEDIYRWIGEPENPPLTLEQLKERVGKMVWFSWDGIGWSLVVNISASLMILAQVNHGNGLELKLYTPTDIDGNTYCYDHPLKETSS